MNRKFFFLAGMPRAGSTLLTSILNQNPSVFASSSSPVCNTLYWSHRLWSEQVALQANPNPTAVQAVLRSIIPSFYSTRNERIIIDKAFSWGTPDNLAVLTNALGYAPKFIVMDRPEHEVLNSFLKLVANSPQYTGDIRSEFMNLSVLSHRNLLAQVPQDCFIVSYDRLCDDTPALLAELYDFIGEPAFHHDLSHIVNTCTDDDTVWGLDKMHQIRNTVSRV